MAVRNGVGISGIDLWLLGGVAKMTGDTPSAGVEFRMAAAGPLVSAVLAVVFGAGAILTAGSLDLALAPGPPPTPAFLVFFNLALVNAAVVVFNLVPAFPLDGGRILRSIAWAATGDRLRATRIAATDRDGWIALGMIGDRDRLGHGRRDRLADQRPVARDDRRLHRPGGAEPAGRRRSSRHGSRASPWPT